MRSANTKAILSTLMVQVQELHHAGDTFHELMSLMERLTRLGLVHCDYNEFNLLVRTFK